MKVRQIVPIVGLVAGAVVLAGTESYIVSTLRLSAVAQQCGWDGYQIIQSLTGEHLAQLEDQHPFCQRTGKFFAGDEFVDNATGTATIIPGISSYMHKSPFWHIILE